MQSMLGRSNFARSSDGFRDMRFGTTLIMKAAGRKF